jgi:hypothetical protein
MQRRRDEDEDEKSDRASHGRRNFPSAMTVENSKQ